MAAASREYMPPTGYRGGPSWSDYASKETHFPQGGRSPSSGSYTSSATAAQRNARIEQPSQTQTQPQPQPQPQTQQGQQQYGQQQPIPIPFPSPAAPPSSFQQPRPAPHSYSTVDILPPSQSGAAAPGQVKEQFPASIKRPSGAGGAGGATLPPPVASEERTRSAPPAAATASINSSGAITFPAKPGERRATEAELAGRPVGSGSSGSSGSSISSGGRSSGTSGSSSSQGSAGGGVHGVQGSNGVSGGGGSFFGTEDSSKGREYGNTSRNSLGVLPKQTAPHLDPDTMGSTGRMPSITPYSSNTSESTLGDVGNPNRQTVLAPGGGGSRAVTAAQSGTSTSRN